MNKSATVAALALLLVVAETSDAAPGGRARPGAPAYKRPWIGEACKQEFFSLCSQLPSDSRRDAIIDCLKQHAQSLSPSCSEAISDGHAESPQAPSPAAGRGFGRHHAQPQPDGGP